MLSVVCDTNVYISAYNFGGTAREVLLYLLEQEVSIYISPAILDEVEGILNLKFNWPAAKLEETIQNIQGFTILVKPKKRLKVVSRDPDDDRIIECAVAADADFIISGDRDLLAIGRYKKVRIISLRQFLDQFTLKKAA